MSWIFIIISSYVLFAGSALVDKYLMSGIAVKPKIYIFYVGVFGMLVFLLIPIVGFVFPSLLQFVLGVASGAFLMFAIFQYLQGLKFFEPSRIVPAIGGLTPIFTFLLLFFISRGKETFSALQFVSFFFLLGGTMLITFEKEKMVNTASLRIAALSAFFTALSFIFAKYLYLSLPFWTGLMLIRVGAFFIALLLLLISREVQKEIFGAKKESASTPFREQPKVAIVFFAGQAMGALAEVLRSFAVFLVPLLFLPFIYALQGVEYVALFFFALLLSLWLPKIMQEEISFPVMLQKIFAVLCIIVGLIALSYV